MSRADLAVAIEALSKEGHVAKNLAGSGKISEPCVTISLEHDGMWTLDFYSYALDLNDHSRHHVMGAQDYETFVDHLWAMVSLARRENLRTKEYFREHPEARG